MTPDLLGALKVERRRVRSDLALHTGRVWFLQPGQFRDMQVRDVLVRVPYLSAERRRILLADTETESLYGGELSREQELALARRLAAIAKERAG